VNINRDMIIINIVIWLGRLEIFHRNKMFPAKEVSEELSNEEVFDNEEESKELFNAKKIPEQKISKIGKTCIFVARSGREYAM
jgi:hypothetical protein